MLGVGDGVLKSKEKVLIMDVDQFPTVDDDLYEVEYQEDQDECVRDMVRDILKTEVRKMTRDTKSQERVIRAIIVRGNRQVVNTHDINFRSYTSILRSHTLVS